LYTGELDFGQTIWDKAEVLLGKSWGTTLELGEPHGNRMRTLLGTREKTKITYPFPSAKQKKTESIECLLIDCMKVLFSKLFVIIFGLS
jgi:hypothetical protein